MSKNKNTTPLPNPYEMDEIEFYENGKIKRIVFRNDRYIWDFLMLAPGRTDEVLAYLKRKEDMQHEQQHID